MSYDNLSSVSQNVLKFISSFPVKRGGSLSFLTIFTSKVKIVKNEKDPPLFTGKLLIKFQNILRNTTHVIIRKFISSFPVKRGGSLSFLTIFTFAVPELLDLI
jgi:GT2 family glycosyltransferase